MRSEQLKTNYIMWAVFGRNGGLITMFRTKWKADEYTEEHTDWKIKKVNIELAEYD